MLLDYSVTTAEACPNNEEGGLEPVEKCAGSFMQIIIIYTFNPALHLPHEIHKTIFIVHLARFSDDVFCPPKNYHYFCATIIPKHYGRE